MKNIVAYVLALSLSIAVLFGAHQAQAHSEREVLTGVIIGLGVGLAARKYANRHRNRHHSRREYFPTGPAYYPRNYYVPQPYSYGQPYYYGPPYPRRRHH